MTQAGRLMRPRQRQHCTALPATSAVVLTAHSVAMGRADAGAKRLDEYIGGLKGTGVLAGFNREYKKRRMAAAANGAGYLTYSKALARLRAALVPVLNSGQKPAVGTLFAEIFR